MRSRLEESLAKATRLLAFALWAAVGAANIPGLVADTSAAAEAKCSDACDGCQIDNCKFCGQVNGVQCYDPIKVE